MEKPLHVRVAEALGCKPVFIPNGEYSWFDCGCGNPWTHAISPEQVGSGEPALLRYDTDWSATGPLIEQQRIAVLPYRLGIWRALRMPMHGVNDEVYVEDLTDRAEGETPLIAVCNLILALHVSGKLPSLLEHTTTT